MYAIIVFHSYSIHNFFLLNAAFPQTRKLVCENCLNSTSQKLLQIKKYFGAKKLNCFLKFVVFWIERHCFTANIKKIIQWSCIKCLLTKPQFMQMLNPCRIYCKKCLVYEYNYEALNYTCKLCHYILIFLVTDLLVTSSFLKKSESIIESLVLQLFEHRMRSRPKW